MTNLKILCLHGYTQNGIIFNKKTAVIRKQLKDIADFVYVTGPHKILVPEYDTIEEREASASAEESEELAPHAWWFKRDEAHMLKDFHESLEFLKPIIEKDGPFDGVIGFSQGAVFAALLTSLMERPNLHSAFDPAKTTFRHPPFRFAMLFSGFKLTTPAFAPWYAVPIKTTSLHMIGKLDTLVSPERQEALAEAFDTKSRTVLYHEGGHFIPSNAQARKSYRDFITKLI